MSVQVCYYCVKSATDIAKLALEYRKSQEINKLTVEVEKYARVAETIKSFCNLIRDDIQTMMHMYFKSACENLNYAMNAEGSNKLDYLRQAKNRFIDATTIEKNENLILSFIGLAICQGLTNDNDNSAISLNKIKRVYCELPNDYETLYSMAPYFDDWGVFIAKMMFNNLIRSSWSSYMYKDSFEYTWDKTWGMPERHIKDKHYFFDLQNRKKYFRRYYDVYKVLGGFSFNEQINEERMTQVCKRILEEDFNKMKEEVISQFQI